MSLVVTDNVENNGEENLAKGLKILARIIARSIYEKHLKENDIIEGSKCHE